MLLSPTGHWRGQVDWEGFLSAVTHGVARLKYQQSREVIIQKAGWNVQGWEGGGRCRQTDESL